jgi:hypothetical protein
VADLSDYAWLVGDEQAAALLATLTDDPRPEIRQLESLRRELPAERARLVVEQAELRRRAVAKFGSHSHRMFFTPVHLEQATDHWVGRYKASRIRGAAAGALVHDYCCGIGGDLIWLADPSPSIGWDQSDAACLLAEANVRATSGSSGADQTAVRQADVEQLTPGSGDLWHVDPDRRAAGKRSSKVDLYSPPPELVDRWLETSPSGSVKLAPAAEAPASWATNAELEWITSKRECRQQVAWFGSLAREPGKHRATVVSSDFTDGAIMSATFAGTPDVSLKAAPEPLQYLYDPDPSVLAAHLLGALADRHELNSLGGSAYLTGNQPIDAPLLQGFVIRESLPLRTATVAQLMADRAVGRVEVKKRGVAIDPEKFRRELKLRGDNEATIVLTRIGKREVALICERMPKAPGAERTARRELE